MQMIFDKCPFKEIGKLSKLFGLVLRDLNLPAGSDTRQNKILRDPAEQDHAGYQTARN
jgi:hypothetical protein